MDGLVECKECGQVVETDGVHIIRTIIECCDKQSIYSGFLCNGCAELLVEED